VSTRNNHKNRKALFSSISEKEILLRREDRLKNKNLKGNMIKSENPLDYLELIVLDLMNKEEGWHFLYPVEPEALGITDYFDKIKIPMDFSTILEKARQQNYKEIETFKNDILLIFQNATFYNSKGTEVHNAALALEEKFTNMYKMLENIRDNKNQKSKIEIEGHLKDHNGVLEKSKEEYDILNKELSELEKRQ